MNQIVSATKNAGKAREYRQMFQTKGVAVKTLLDFKKSPQIRETGHTFEENAMIKARTVTHWLKMPVLADDSGLEVTSLNGEPGVYSARYAGDHDDAANQKKLLRRLNHHQDRRARFVTCLVLLKPTGQKLVVSGQLRGQILSHPRGYNGFGYDPLFYVPKYHQTLAEMTMAQKDAISHRGIAARKMMKRFDKWWN